MLKSTEFPSRMFPQEKFYEEICFRCDCFTAEIAMQMHRRRIHYFIIMLNRPFSLPEMWEKHCVRVVIANPDANAVANSTDETLAPTPAPAAAPHTINTYRNEAKHSAIMDLLIKI